jgi:hypothetical protein
MVAVFLLKKAKENPVCVVNPIDGEKHHRNE